VRSPQHETAIDDGIRDEGFATVLQTIKKVPIEGIEVALHSRLSEIRPEVTRHAAEAGAQLVRDQLQLALASIIGLLLRTDPFHVHGPRSQY
jgi:hypothetical protein